MVLSDRRQKVRRVRHALRHRRVGGIRPRRLIEDALEKNTASLCIRDAADGGPDDARP